MALLASAISSSYNLSNFNREELTSKVEEPFLAPVFPLVDEFLGLDALVPNPPPIPDAMCLSQENDGVL
jgi:hypothetical protein